MQQESLTGASWLVCETYEPVADAVVYAGTAADFLTSLPDESVQLIITSPPYNIGKGYEQRQTIEAYLEAQQYIIPQLYRVLRPTGSICWQVGNYVEDGEVYPLDIYYYPLFKQAGLALRNRVIWHFGHGLHASRRFSGRYETLLWFTKSPEYTFNLDAVRVPAKYPGKRAFKGPNKGKPSGNPAGKNPSDFWQMLTDEWSDACWDIPNVKANHPEKTLHPCQFPVELAERCVLALSNTGDVVLDPYAGVGSALVAALKHGRRAWGSDKEPDYTDLTRERIAALAQGTLRTRPLGKPVHTPSGNEKVARVPEEWQDARQARLLEHPETSYS